MTHIWIAAFALAVSGCATITIPPDRLERSTATIRAAEELGAAHVPEARLHLQFAKEEADAARRLAANGDDRALIVLARSQSDAALALSLAHEAQVRRDALQAVADLQAVEERGATP